MRLRADIQLLAWLSASHKLQRRASQVSGRAGLGLIAFLGEQLGAARQLPLQQIVVHFDQG